MESSFVSAHGWLSQTPVVDSLPCLCVRKQDLGDIVDDFRDSCTIAFGANFCSVLHGIDQDGSTNL